MQLSEGLESIEAVAFSQCAIEEVRIPASVTHIGSQAFYQSTAVAGSVQLKKVYFTDTNGWVLNYPGANPPKKTPLAAKMVGNPEKMVQDYFLNMELYQFAVLDKESGSTPTPTTDCLTFKLLSDGTFSVAIKTDYRDSTTKVVIPAEYNGIKVTQIAEEGFKNCKLLTSVYLPDTVTSIGAYAFYDCSALTAVEIPDSVETTGISVFNGCTALSSVRLSENLEALSDSMFNNCSALESIVIPEKIQKLGYYCMSKTGIQKITIPKAVNFIGAGCFSSTPLKEAYMEQTTGWKRSCWTGSDTVDSQKLASPTEAAKQLLDYISNSDGSRYEYTWRRTE